MVDMAVCRKVGAAVLVALRSIMEFEIVRAVPEDAEEIAAIMKTGKAGMENPEWFIEDDAEYIREHIGHIPIAEKDCGFSLKAVTRVEDREVIAGFFMVDFPGIGVRNLGHHIELDEKSLAKVAHMDSVVILPQFRGHKLQYRLIACAEEILRQETDYTIWMATVHPDNKYSLSNVQAHGYEVIAEALKYGGYRRYVLKKEL